MTDLLSPDNSVRAAGPADVAALGAVHARSWTGPYAAVLPPAVVAALTPDLLAEAWRSAVTAPPSPDHRVLVAVGDGIVAGFAAAAPAEGASSAAASAEDVRIERHQAGAALEVVALEIDPLHTRRGHGSRLLSAVVDAARSRGWPTIQVWVHQDDGARLEFLRGAGLREDGARRRRGIAGGAADTDADDARSVWPEVRLSASLDLAPDPVAEPGSG